jgi:acyl dehydratase
LSTGETQLSSGTGARRFRSETFDVSRRDIAKFATAIGARSPIYFNTSAARRIGYRDVVAPPSFYVALGMARGKLKQRSELMPDGLPDGEPLAGMRMMAGDTDVRLHYPIVAGDSIKVSQRLVNTYEREGRSGHIRFMTFERRYVRQDDLTVAVERYVRLAR